MAKRKPPATTTNGHATPPRVGSYFLSLSLENVRCFGPKQTLDLSDGHGKPARWTILVGANGTGKTTLLQALVGVESFPQTLANWSGTIPVPRWISAHTEAAANLLRKDCEWPATVTAELCEGPTLTSATKELPPVNLTVQPTGEIQSSHAPASLWCCGYGVTRRMGTGSLEESGSADPAATLFTDRVELRNAHEWLLQLDYGTRLEVQGQGKQLQVKQQRTLAQVKELLLRIFQPEVRGIKFTSIGGVYGGARAEFQTPYGWVPLRQLGYGYQTLIAWVVDLASRMVERYPDSADPLAEPAFVAVDEIDLHLHPIWQRQLMGYLTERFPNTQFVATAHSPLVVQAAANANLAVLRRQGDHVVIENDVEDIKSWRVDQILTSELFGLPSARLPEIEALLAERQRLLTQSKLSPADWKRVREIEAITGDLPTAETAQDLQDQTVIRKTLDRLTQEAQHR